MGQRLQFEAKRLELQRAVEALSEPLKEAESSVTRAFNASNGVAAEDLGLAKLRELTAEGEAAFKAATESLDRAVTALDAEEQRLTTLPAEPLPQQDAQDAPTSDAVETRAEGLDEALAEKLSDLRNEEIGQLRSQAARLKDSLDGVEATIARARERAVKAEAEELEALQASTLTALRSIMTEHSQTAAQLLEQAGVREEKMTCEQFMALVATAPGLKLVDGDVARVFSHIADGNGSLSQERFNELLRLFFRVVNQTVLSIDLPIKSKTLRRLSINEVLECIEGPKKDERVSVMRVRCRTVQDDTVGWATLAGNQGTKYLEPWGRVMRCIQECILRDGPSREDSRAIRPLTKGEVMDVIEFQRRDSKSDIMQIRGKARGDGAEGWAAVNILNGETYMEPI